jgi:hypothetical protein
MKIINRKNWTLIVLGIIVVVLAGLSGYQYWANGSNAALVKGSPTFYCNFDAQGKGTLKSASEAEKYDNTISFSAKNVRKNVEESKYDKKITTTVDGSLDFNQSFWGNRHRSFSSDKVIAVDCENSAGIVAVTAVGSYRDSDLKIDTKSDGQMKFTFKLSSDKSTLDLTKAEVTYKDSTSNLIPTNFVLTTVGSNYRIDSYTTRTIAAECSKKPLVFSHRTSGNLPSSEGRVSAEGYGLIEKSSGGDFMLAISQPCRDLKTAFDFSKVSFSILDTTGAVVYKSEAKDIYASKAGDYAVYKWKTDVNGKRVPNGTYTIKLDDATMAKVDTARTSFGFIVLVN